MKSIGKILKDAREERGLSLDQVIDDTNISRSYLIALEEEKFDEFPGETYLIGFLRTYGEFLDLDASSLLNLYRNHKISEEPVPVNELIGRKERKPLSPLVLIIPVVLILVGVLIWTIPMLIPLVKGVLGNESSSSPESVQYVLEKESLEEIFYSGDQLLVQEGNRDYLFTLDFEDKRWVVNGTGSVEGSHPLFLNDGQVIQPEDSTLSLVFLLKDSGLSHQGSRILIHRIKSATSVETPIITVGLPEDKLLITTEKKIIYTADTPTPFNLDIEFSGFTLFRYEVPEEGRVEKRFQEGDRFRLENRASVLIWASDAGSLYAKIAGYEVPFGKPGEVTVRLITWESHEEGIYNLVIVPVQ